MQAEITMKDVAEATKRGPWDLGNQILYDLCSDHPRHDEPDAIIAKFWLIGRTYAAAIERRRNAEDTSDDFYETVVVDRVRRSGLDRWLDALPARMTDPWTDLGAVVTVHKRLIDLFKSMTGLEKRSLASKYLHFHRPDLFFIYDSRAREAITKVTPCITAIRDSDADESDGEYLIFCRRAQHLRDDIKARFGKDLTPRQLDKALLMVTARLRKAGT